MKLAAVSAAAVVVLVAGALATYYLVRTRPDHSVAAVTKPAPRVDAASASEITERNNQPQAPPATASSADVAAAEFQPPAASALFPAPDSHAAATTTPAPPVAAAPQTASASLAPARATDPVVSPAPDSSTDAATASPRAPKSAPPTSPGLSSPPAPPPEGTTERLVYDGRALLAQGKYPQALEAFNQAMKKDRNNADAWHGSGLCYQGMGSRDLAVERLEKAVALYDPPSRAAVYNAAAANLRDNPMRAAKMVKDYLARDPDGHDEAMHTLLGRALFAVSRQGRLNKLYAEVQDFYFAYNDKINATRTDGRKRWGSDWVPGPEATERWNRYRTRQQNVENLRTIVDHDTKAKKDAWDRFNDMRNAMRLVGEVEMRQSRERYEAAARQEIASRQQLKAAEVEFNSTERPPFPQIVKPVPMDPMSPGLLGH
jgi:tetratricopeptide (TPR) repeat protein